MKVRHRRVGSLCLGEIDIPTTTPGTIKATATGRDPAEALARCAAVAQRICDDPVMAMLMSESVAADLREIRMLASAACESPRAVREVIEELGITVTGGDPANRRKGRLRKSPRYKLATDLHAVAKSRGGGDDDGGDDDDDQGDDGDDDGADNSYDRSQPYQNPSAPYQAPSQPATAPSKPRLAPMRAQLGDIVNGRNASIDGFWDDVQSAASQAGSAAWQLAKDHRKEIAIGLATARRSRPSAGAAPRHRDVWLFHREPTAAGGPAAGVAAAKAMDLLNAAQNGHPDAAKAVAQVAAKSDAGDPKAKLMATVIKRELVTQAKNAAAGAPEHPEMEHPAAQPDGHEGGADNSETAPDVERDHGEGTEAFGGAA